MSSEQIYCLAMMQLSLVLLLASSRIKVASQQRSTLAWLQWALLADATSWLFYLWPQHWLWLSLSALGSAANLFAIAVFVYRRCAQPAPWFWLVVWALVQALSYIWCSLQGYDLLALHFLLLVCLMILPGCILTMIRFKQPHTSSDGLFTAALLLWLLVCLSRSWLALVNPAWLESGLLVSQAVWPTVGLAYGIFALTAYLEEVQLKLQQEASHDTLTGLLNRRGLHEAAPLCLSKYDRAGQPAAVFLLDLDHFKAVNDQHGHEAGDQVLQLLADVLRQQLRQSDVICRYGGEEFLVLLPQTSVEQACQIADRLLQQVRQLKPCWLPDGATLSISIGIAAFYCTGAEELGMHLRRADQALYRAKANGRDRIELAT